MFFPPTAGWRWSSGSPLGFQGSLSEWDVLGVPRYCLHSGLHWSHRGVGGLITTEQRHKICLSLGLLWYQPSRQGGREVPHRCWLGGGNQVPLHSGAGKGTSGNQVPLHRGAGKGTSYWTARMENPPSSLASLIPHYAGEPWGMSPQTRASGILGSLHCGGWSHSFFYGFWLG